MIRFLIHKPIAVLMSTIAIIVLGLIAWSYIPVSLMPDVDIPEISVQLSADLSAREIEDAVVRPLRNNLMQVSHLEEIKSESYHGSAVIKLVFTHGAPIDYAFIEVNEKIDRAMGQLPRELDRPRVIKARASDIPVFYLNLSLKEGKATATDGHLTTEFIDFNRFANQVIRKRIEQLPEVALVDVNGIISTEILVVPAQEKMMALGIGLNDLEVALRKQDIEIGSILVRDNQYQYNLRIGFQLDNISDVGEIYLNLSGRLIQLNDLAEIREQPQKRRGLSLYNGEEAINMAIIKQGDALMSQLKASLEATLDQMEADYPDISFSIVRDQTKLLNEAIDNLGQGMFWGILLAFFIMFFFLKDMISPLLIGISVPVSLVISLLFFYLLDISINIISLSGLILGSGLMIDNSIIVIDNITQYRERGHSLSEACVKGANEVIKPLISSALTTCAVFVPLIFLNGIAGALFYDQAMAITIGLFVSFLVSVTLLPVLYRLFHRKHVGRKGIRGFPGKLDVVDYAALYEKGFRFTMKRQRLMLVLFGSLVFVSIALFFFLPKAQVPELTATEKIYKIDWNSPISVEENKQRILELTLFLEPELENFSAQVGQQQFLMNRDAQTKTSETELYVQVESPNDLKSIYQKTVEYLTRYPEAVVEVMDVDNIFNLIFSGESAPLTAHLRAIGQVNNSSNQLESLWNNLQQALPHVPLQPIAWEELLSLRANAAKMELYGITPAQLSTTLSNAFNEQQVLSIMDHQDFVPVVLGAQEKTVAQVLEQTHVRANDSTYYKVSHFLTQNLDKDLKSITAGKQGVYYPLDFQILQDQEAQITEEVEAVVTQTPGFDVSFTGSLIENRMLIKELTVVMAISLALLFFILATQFESLLLPLIILLEIPISLAGALFLLWICGMSLNLMSMIGIVVMCGIVINDSILKIDIVIQLQKEGNGLLRALLVAGKRRLKPILMTSLTTVLAVMPILFTAGLGGELQAPLAVALIGGMLLGTMVSLYLIPLLYYNLNKNKRYAPEELL